MEDGRSRSHRPDQIDFPILWFFARGSGAEAAPPEILERIHALQIEAPARIASAPPYPN